MRALLLSSVRMRGLETMRTIPLDSAAERRRLRLKALLMAPSVMPRAPPCPVPTVAGRLTAKLGFETVLVNGERPAVGVLWSLAPPTTPIDAGKASPVGLPVAGLSVPSP